MSVTKSIDDTSAGSPFFKGWSFVIRLGSGIFLSLVAIALTAYGFTQAFGNNLADLGIQHCRKLAGLPFAEDLGVIESVQAVSLSLPFAPYNGGIIDYRDGYLMVYRYDIPHPINYKGENLRFKTRIGFVLLDSEFTPISEPKNLNTGSDFSEDARIFKIGTKYYLAYNDVPDGPLYARVMKLSEFNPENGMLSPPIDLDINIHSTEKNWVPFEYSEEKPVLHFGYNINPHKILVVEDPLQKKITQPIYPFFDCYQHIPWGAKWGNPRGGTPALRVGDEYLAFFHSFFKDPRLGLTYYVMGAYTFQANPPFKITAISKFPILYKDIYLTTHSQTALKKIKCLYPVGFTIKKVEGKEKILLSCGENDSIIKIFTLDKEALYKTLIPLPQERSLENNRVNR